MLTCWFRMNGFPTNLINSSHALHFFLTTTWQPNTKTKKYQNCFLYSLLHTQFIAYCVFPNHTSKSSDNIWRCIVNLCVLRFENQSDFIPPPDLQSSCPPTDEGCHQQSSQQRPQSTRAASQSTRGCLGCYWKPPRHPATTGQHECPFHCCGVKRVAMLNCCD